ncbi:MAG: hypothetical protein KF841_05970 [Phycisphaerae bacterium]|nr:hypothetical protein [Phycisphaerae bacterium]
MSRKNSTTCRLLALAFGLPCFAPMAIAQEAPQIVRISPKPGSTDVDPAIRELRVEFDRDMQIGSHSVCGGGDSFPKLRGDPVWEDARNFVLRVKLEPEHEYVMNLNCPSSKGFRSSQGVPLEMTPWQFTTRAASDTKKLSQKELNEKSLDELLKALRDRYSYYDRKQIDWDRLVESHRKKILASKSTKVWIKRVAGMLSVCEDPHLWIQYRDKTTATYQLNFMPNFNLKGVEAEIGALTRRNRFALTADLGGGIAYLLILSWSGGDYLAQGDLQMVLAELRPSKGLILDVRPNGGGDESFARNVASWFVEGEHTYSKCCYRDVSAKGGFGPMIDRKIVGNPEDRRIKCPVIILMGPNNMSSCESFLLMMKQAKGVTLVGGKSSGSSGNPKALTLENDVTMFIPSWKDFMADGGVLEGVGIKPDIVVRVKPNEIEKGDPIIRRAIDLLKRKPPDNDSPRRRAAE